MQLSFRKISALGASVLLIFAASLTAQISTSASADLVLGQSDFNTNAAATTSDSNFVQPNGIAIDPTTGKVFVVDSSGNRVLRYPPEDALGNGAAAEVVFGQDDFSDVSVNGGESNPTSRGLSFPISVQVDSAGRLWVADSGNNRILMWTNASALGSDAAANLVLGQINFTSGASGLSASEFTAPSGLWIDGGGDLWVSDRINNRVLRFANAAALADGAAATQVIGQDDFISSGSTFLPLGIDRLAQPVGVMLDTSSRLWVGRTVPTTA